MKKLFRAICFLIIAITVSAQHANFPKLTGPYLGQKPPGNTPELLAPGIVSTEKNEHMTPAFSPSGL